MICNWDNLPAFMRSDSVRPYYEILRRRRGQLFAKRVFDLLASIIMLLLLSPVLLIISVAVRADSKGGALFRQERVTQYGKHFIIYKFRTMVTDAELMGAQVTTGGDPRITKVGKKLRDTRLDELPQLINILKGEMSFVGVRPEVPRYVEKYTDEMNATLLLPAGVTSKASILYKDESRLLQDAVDTEETYINSVLPGKMKYNLEGMKEFSLITDIRIMLQTVKAVI